MARLVWLLFISVISCQELTTSTASLSLQSPASSFSTLSHPTRRYDFDLSSKGVATTTSPIQVLPTHSGFVTSATSSSDPAETSTSGNRYPIRPLFQNETFNSEAFVIDLTVNQKHNPLHFVCWYPISGNYCRLPRILFYVTIVAALLLRNHVWLYAGALAASLTYSGTAAIHACLLIWSGPSWGESDLIALLAILATSCLIMVPLLNWSSLLQHSKEDKEEDDSQTDERKSKDSDASSDFQVAEATRLVLVCWSFLVFVALICLVLAVTGQLLTRHRDQVLVLWNIWADSRPAKIICTPSGGQMNFTAGQRPTNSDQLSSFQLSKEFLSQNNCPNPCGTPIMGKPIFRGNEDLVPVPLLLNDDVGPASYHSSQQIDRKLQFGFMSGGIMIIFFIIAQGIWAILCGPRSPAEVRARLYLYITRFKLRGRPESVASLSRQRLAKHLALFVYAYSIAMALVSIPLFVLAIVAVEGFLQYLPQNESEIHVGAWSPWANTGLILFAAFISRFHASISSLTRLEFWTRLSVPNVRGAARGMRKAMFVTPWAYASDTFVGIIGDIRQEWREATAFWKDPECSSSEYGITSETSKGEQDEGIGLPSINRLSKISMTDFGLPKLSTGDS